MTVSFISGEPEYLEKTIDLSQVTDKCYFEKIVNNFTGKIWNNSQC